MRQQFFNQAALLIQEGSCQGIVDLNRYELDIAELFDTVVNSLFDLNPERVIRFNLNTNSKQRHTLYLKSGIRLSGLMGQRLK